MRPRAVAAAALVLASGLGVAPAAAPALAAAVGSVADRSVADRAVVLGSAPVGLLRSDPENGSWARRTPSVARLSFTSGAAARAAAVQVSTPRRTAAAGVRVTVSGPVVSVHLPDDGPGDYRVVWYVLPAGGKDPGYAADGADGAAGTIAFRVGGVAPTAAPGTPGTATGAARRRTSAAGSFTIPDRPSASAVQDEGAGGTAPAPGTATRTSTATPSAAAVTVPTAPAVPAPAVGATTSAPAGLLPDAGGLAATALAGLLACTLATRWSWRRATAAGLRPR